MMKTSTTSTGMRRTQRECDRLAVDTLQISGHLHAHKVMDGDACTRALTHFALTPCGTQLFQGARDASAVAAVVDYGVDGRWRARWPRRSGVHVCKVQRIYFVAAE